MKKNLSVILIFISLAIGLLIAFKLYILGRIVDYQEEKKALEMMTKLEAGINIGNDLDTERVKRYIKNPSVYDYETAWGNVPVTKEVFEAVAAAGFKTVRIPVSWYEHMDENNKIDVAFKYRVREVVDMALDQGLYVILNNHHENFIKPSYSREEPSKKKLVDLWTQVAEEFADYDQRLLFESMNEPRLKDTDEEWTAGKEESREVVNRLNEAFIEAVRNSGENNKKRYLLIPAYASSSKPEALKGMRIPDDDNYLMVSVHGYLPHKFTDNSRNTQIWDKHDAELTGEILELQKNLKEVFLDKRIPVVISEFGCQEKESEEERLKWLAFYVEPLAQMGIPCIWWDDGGDYKILDRENARFENEALVDELVGFYR